MENVNVNWIGEMMCIAMLLEVHRPANWSVGIAGQIMQYTDTAQCMMSCKRNLVLLYTTTNFRNTPTYRTTASASFVIIIHAYRTTASVSLIWWLSMFAVDLLDDAMKSAGTSFIHKMVHLKVPTCSADKHEQSIHTSSDLNGLINFNRVAFIWPKLWQTTVIPLFFVFHI